MAIEQGMTEFDYPPKTGAFRFKLGDIPMFASIARPGYQAYEIPQKFVSLVHHKGFVQEDPRFLFGRRGSISHGADKMPLRGIKEFGPFDGALSLSPGDHPIRLSIVCPKAESGLLEQFLAGIEQNWQPVNPNKEDYLVGYSGFEREFLSLIHI